MSGLKEILDNGEKLVAIAGGADGAAGAGRGGFLSEPAYFNAGLTDDPSMLIREGALERLREAKKGLPRGWNFKIWDMYRPLSVQSKLYKDLWNLRMSENPSWDEARLKSEVEKFVAFPSYDPLKPSPHNTGGAIDLTIVTDSGIELPMGTYFDEFHERSYGDYFEKNPGEDGAEGFQANRQVLREILDEVGFAPDKWEWWHFSYGNQDWAEHRGEKVAIYGSVEL